jgi:hypothetical protein
MMISHKTLSCVFVSFLALTSFTFGQDWGTANGTKSQISDSGYISVPKLKTHTDVMTTLIRAPNFQKELELVGSQYQQLKALSSKKTEMLIEETNRYIEQNKLDVESLTNVQRQHAAKACAEALGDRIRKQLKEILLPHQLQKLEQLVFQRLLKEIGLAELLTSHWARELLEIDSDQASQIKTKAATEDEKLKEQLIALKRKSEEKLLKQLSPEQRAKLFDVVPKEALLTQETAPAKTEK